MKTIKSNYAVIDDNMVYLHDIKPKIYPAFDTLLRDVEITFVNDCVIEVVGNEIIFGLTFDGFYYKNQDVHEDYIKIKFDLFSFKKKPYVKSGWYRKNKTVLYKEIRNNFKIICTTF